MHTHLGQAQVPGGRDVVSRKLVHGASGGDKQLIRHGEKSTVQKNSCGYHGEWKSVRTRQHGGGEVGRNSTEEGGSGATAARSSTLIELNKDTVSVVSFLLVRVALRFMAGSSVDTNTSIQLFPHGKAIQAWNDGAFRPLGVLPLKLFPWRLCTFTAVLSIVGVGVEGWSLLAYSPKITAHFLRVVVDEGGALQVGVHQVVHGVLLGQLAVQGDQDSF